MSDEASKNNRADAGLVQQPVGRAEPRPLTARERGVLNSALRKSTVKVADGRSGPRVDIGRYAGTYGGYIIEQPKPLTLWQRFRAVCGGKVTAIQATAQVRISEAHTDAEKLRRLRLVAGQVLRDMQAHGVLLEWHTELQEALDA
jgi:hypothetical protein